MVHLTRQILGKVRVSNRKYLGCTFRDTLRIFVQGGNGGNGYPKFGGIGGKGGDVKVVAKENISLDHVFKRNRSNRYIAGNGRHSTHNFILGLPGEDLVFPVPVGVSVVTGELGKNLGELNEEGEEITIAKGGPGGNPKNGFLGIKGQGYPVNLNLKLIADIGLVGFPNAGKSTLLKAISNSKPKIASYPFTTVKPNVGMLMYKDLRQISMADLPGLIEGAYANKGMGHKFLKHVERTKLLLLIVDINGFQLSPHYPHRSCLETVLLLNKELELYNEELLEKPAMIIINKMDTEGAQEKFLEIKEKLTNLADHVDTFNPDMLSKKMLKFIDIIPISAKENSDDVNTVKERVRHLLDIFVQLRQKEDDERNANLLEESRDKIRERGPVKV